jgi:hypothetical protein
MNNSSIFVTLLKCPSLARIVWSRDFFKIRSGGRSQNCKKLRFLLDITALFGYAFCESVGLVVVDH